MSGQHKHAQDLAVRGKSCFRGRVLRAAESPISRQSLAWGRVQTLARPPFRCHPVTSLRRKDLRADGGKVGAVTDGGLARGYAGLAEYAGPPLRTAPELRNEPIVRAVPDQAIKFDPRPLAAPGSCGSPINWLSCTHAGDPRVITHFE
jgi:hypothetical protein